MGFFNWIGEQVGNAARTVEVAAQGVAKGLVSGVTGVVDQTAGRLYNGVTSGSFSATNLTAAATDAVTWTEPRNDYERAVMATGQAVGEVGVFVGVTIATAGVGGAAIGGGMAAIRGGTVIGRAATTGGQWASWMARASNPVALNSRLAVAGTSLEAGLTAVRARDLFFEDQESERLAQEFSANAANEVLGGARDRQLSLENYATRIHREAVSLSEEIDRGSLSAERTEQILQRFDDLEEARDIIRQISGSRVPEAERARLEQRLSEILPDQRSEAEQTSRLSFSRDGGTRVLGAEFANVGEGRALPARDERPASRENEVAAPRLT